MITTTKSLLVSLAILVAGCGVDAMDDDGQEVGVGGGIDDLPIHKITANGMLPSKIRATTIGLAKLDATAVSNSGLINTAAGRELLTYIVSCAYQPQQTVTGTMTISPYTTFTFQGAVGLSPLWYKGALSASDRRWVSACVMARANYYGTTVSISLQGNHSALAIDFDQDYGIDEGAFFGDILSGGTPQMGACMGIDQAHDNTQGDLPIRKCAAGSAWCGYTFVGNCSDNCTTSTTFPYAGCAVSHYQEVVSVKLNGIPD